MIGWRTPLPVNPLVLGPYAKSTEPFIAQVFVAIADEASAAAAAKPRARAASVDEGLPLETRLFLLRRAVALRAREVFVCSLSCRTITYKGLET